jgi:hypothetical protein
MAWMCSLYLILSVIVCSMCFTVVDNLGISFGTCRFCYTIFKCLCKGLQYVLYCVLCAEGYFYLCVMKEFDDSSYFFVIVCKGGPFCFVALRISVFILLLSERGFPNYVCVTLAVA